MSCKEQTTSKTLYKISPLWDQYYRFSPALQEHSDDDKNESDLLYSLSYTERGGL